MIQLPFRDRVEAGQLLAAELVKHKLRDAVVLALPRGGVPVGFEVAKTLHAPLDVVVVRKRGVRWHPVLAMGAIAGASFDLLDWDLIAKLGISRQEIDAAIRSERAEVQRRENLYRDGRPARVDCVVVSSQHSEKVSQPELREGIAEQVIRAVIPPHMLDSRTKFHINPTGQFITGGPMGDAGLTGRKIIVDTYGGYSRHGGGAFSGKDPTKVDRSACYMARHIAKNLVAAGLARKVEVQIAYAIGVAEPVSVMADTFGTGVLPDEKLTSVIRDNFSLTPKGIMDTLNLRRPIYRATAAYGHFGRREPGFTWEQTEKVDALRQAAGLQPTEVAARR